MRGSADMAGRPDVRSHRAFLCYEIVRQDQPLETELQFSPNFHLSGTCPVRTSIFCMRVGRIVGLAFLNYSFVAPFLGPNSESKNGVRFATSRQTSEIDTPAALHSHAAFLSICGNSYPEGDGCMKDTDHPIRHPSRHLRIFGRIPSRRDCTWRNDQFGRGQNTGLGWSDPTFVHVSVPRVIRGVAPAQLRVDRAECFVRAAFRSRRPQ